MLTKWKVTYRKNEGDFAGSVLVNAQSAPDALEAAGAELGSDGFDLKALQIPLLSLSPPAMATRYRPSAR